MKWRGKERENNEKGGVRRRQGQRGRRSYIG